MRRSDDGFSSSFPERTAKTARLIGFKGSVSHIGNGVRQTGQSGQQPCPDSRIRSCLNVNWGM